MITGPPPQDREEAASLPSLGTVLRWLRGGFGLVWAAIVTGRADPFGKREWPSWLRWTRRILIGRLPFPVALIGADLLMAYILLGTTYSVLLTDARAVEFPASNNFLLLSSAVLTMPVAVRNLFPMGAWRWASLAMLWANTSLHGAMKTPLIPGGIFAYLLVLYSVAVRAERRITIGVWVVSMGGLYLVPTANNQVTVRWLGAVLVTAVLLFGYNVRQRRSAQLEVAQTQREAAEQAKRHQEVEAVLAERQRIARELHDVVAHHMSVIAIQAEAAPYRVKDPPKELTDSFADVRAVALEGLTELRRILGVLRTEDTERAIAPQPGLDRLDDLVATAQGAGHTVETVVIGEPRPVPPAAGLSAYRILQEAVSNVMRHAPGAAVRIELEYPGEVLRLRVTNGPSATAPETVADAGSGHGLVGMRERATMLGGSLTAEPTPDGGFTLTATLPLAGGSEDA